MKINSFCWLLIGLLCFLESSNAQVLAFSSFGPVQAPIGSSINIAGASFNATASAYWIRFGAVTAAVTSASSTRLIATVHSGATYALVTTTTVGFTAGVALPFGVSFPGSQVIDAKSFAAQFALQNSGPQTVAPVIFTASGGGATLSSIAVGELDGDAVCDDWRQKRIFSPAPRPNNEPA